VGKTEVEDALSRLDMLTKEESLNAVVRNLGVTHHIDGVVHDIDDNVKGVDKGTQHFLSVVMHLTDSLSFRVPK
jgi:hypothetical protein